MFQDRLDRYHSEHKGNLTETQSILYRAKLADEFTVNDLQIMLDNWLGLQQETSMSSVAEKGLSKLIPRYIDVPYGHSNIDTLTDVDIVSKSIFDVSKNALTTSFSIDYLVEEMRTRLEIPETVTQKELVLIMNLLINPTRVIKNKSLKEAERIVQQIESIVEDRILKTHKYIKADVKSAFGTIQEKASYVI